MKDLSPSIISTDLDEALGAVKAACLYFPSVSFHLAGLEQLEFDSNVESKEKATGTITLGDSKKRVDDFLNQTRPLLDERVLRIVAIKKEIMGPLSDSFWKFLLKESTKVLEVTKEKEPDKLVETASKLVPAMFRAKGVGENVVRLLLAGGIPTTTSPTLHESLRSLYRGELSNWWDSLSSVERRQRNREEIALSVIRQRIPSIADLSSEDILELREKQNDNLIRFRSELGKLVESAEVSPFGKDFELFTKQILEEKIDPAVLELKSQLDDIRRSATLKSATGTAVAFGTLGFSLMGLLPEATVIAGATAALGNASYNLFERMQKQATTLAGHPMAWLLQMQRATHE